jgi:hypothetical protein
LASWYGKIIAGTHRSEGDFRTEWEKDLAENGIDLTNHEMKLSTAITMATIILKSMHQLKLLGRQQAFEL